jgi:hypothetical protein
MHGIHKLMALSKYFIKSEWYIVEVYKDNKKIKNSFKTKKEKRKNEIGSSFSP